LIRALAILLLAAVGTALAQAPPKEAKGMVTIALTSSAFREGEAIPEKHTCDGLDLSPALAWSGAPAGTRSLALLCDDPDAPVGLWVHWVIWGVPPDTTSLPEGVAREKSLPNGSAQGLNDFRKIGYGGPCPPPGKPHRYFFRIYALDAGVALAPGATRKELLKAIEGHVIGEGELMGRYGRKG
jgi:Raf kinase inhibitor-like YbhB/YbcL family protein